MTTDFDLFLFNLSRDLLLRLLLLFLVASSWSHSSHHNIKLIALLFTSQRTPASHVLVIALVAAHSEVD